MDRGYITQIRERILNAEAGTVFASSDFADIADMPTIRKSLQRLTQNGTLRRILNGIFEKPKYSDFLKEYVAVNPDAVAKALARSYHWTIVPCGNTALNQLGLSTQVQPSGPMSVMALIKLMSGILQNSNSNIEQIKKSQDFLI